MGNTAGTQPTRSVRNYEAFSLIVRFKSVDICDFLMEGKRKAGKITVTEVFGDEILPTIKGLMFVNELLPSRVYKLLKRTKQVALERKYKHVWTNGGYIYVRKEDRSEVLNILIVEDLSKLI